MEVAPRRPNAIPHHSRKGSLTSIEILHRSGSKTLSTSSHKADVVFDDYLPTLPPQPLWELVAPARTFPLLDIPVELQRLVFYHYFGGPYDIALENERLSMLRSRFYVLGMPPIDLLITSKHVHTHAGPIRSRLFTRRLVLNTVFMLVPLRRQPRFHWLRDNVQILHFSDSSIHPERWATYFDSLRQLRKLEIDFPQITRLGVEEGVSMEALVEGKHDDLLLKRIDRLRLVLVHQLREGRRFEIVVRQKYDTKEDDGYLMVEIQLSDTGEKVLSREIVTGKPIGLSLHGRPAELVRANGNVLDSGSHRSLWEWHQEMVST